MRPFYFFLKKKERRKQKYRTNSYLFHKVENMFVLNEPHREKTGFLHMRKQRRRSASW